jgi:hypothetical protein
LAPRRAALAAAKARGTRLGNPNLRGGGTPELARVAAAAKIAKPDARAADLLPLVREIRDAGISSLAGIAKALAARGVPTPSGRGVWTPSSVLPAAGAPARGGRGMTQRSFPATDFDSFSETISPHTGAIERVAQTPPPPPLRNVWNRLPALAWNLHQLAERPAPY